MYYNFSPCIAGDPRRPGGRACVSPGLPSSPSGERRGGGSLVSLAGRSRWGAYSLGADDSHVVVFQLETGTIWPIEAVAKNWAATTATFWKQLEESKRRRRGGPLDTRLSDWISLTRSLATDFDHGPSYRDAMVALADAVEAELVQGQDRHLDRVDQSRRGVQETQFNAMLWAAAELGNAATAAQLPWNGADWHRALFRDERAYGDDQERALAARVRPFDKKVQPEQREPLVAEVLEAILSHGPFLPDGSLRPIPRSTRTH